MTTMKVIVTGYAGHGKDTFCEMLMYPFRSSSLFICEKVVLPVLSEKYGYTTVEECYNDRSNHRQEWYELIAAYCKDDKARLCREIFNECDIYCGIRSIDELRAAKEAGLVDLVIWVDASNRLPPESSSSMTITPGDCDIIINNNHGKEELQKIAQILTSMFSIIKVSDEMMDMFDKLRDTGKHEW